MDMPFSAAPTPRLASGVDRFHAREGSPPVEWRVLDGLVPYESALVFMEERVAAIAAGEAAETVLFLEHPPLYTAGTGAEPTDLVQPDRFPVFSAGRGGQYTYHGPGQRVAYVMLDLKRRRQDVRLFVSALEAWIVETLAEFQVRGERREDRVGVWVRRPERAPGPGGATAEDKIAAIGISLNVEPDLSHFDGIVPCGVREHGVTSLVDLGLPVTMADADLALRRSFETVFGPTTEPAR